MELTKRICYRTFLSVRFSLLAWQHPWNLEINERVSEAQGVAHGPEVWLGLALIATVHRSVSSESIYNRRLGGIGIYFDGHSHGLLSPSAQL